MRHKLIFLAISLFFSCFAKNGFADNYYSTIDTNNNIQYREDDFGNIHKFDYNTLQYTTIYKQ